MSIDNFLPLPVSNYTSTVKKFSYSHLFTLAFYKPYKIKLDEIKQAFGYIIFNNNLSQIFHSLQHLNMSILLCTKQNSPRSEFFLQKIKKKWELLKYVMASQKDAFNNIFSQ